MARTIGRAVSSQGRGALAGRSGRFALVLLAALSLSCRHGKAGTGANTLFLCGDKPCHADTSYCEMLKTDNLRLPSTYACKPLPDSCLSVDRTADDCACFPKGTRCDFCSSPERKGVRFFQRTCIGGY